MQQLARVAEYPGKKYVTKMTRKRYTTSFDVSEISKNILRTNVLAFAIADYDHLDKLSGAKPDLDMIAEIFAENGEVCLYDLQYKQILNPTANQFREEIIHFSTSRSARGDILILYFSGHGAVVGTTEFAFCLQDTNIGLDRDKILAITGVRFNDLLQTLSAVEVYPVIIIDACFSSVTAAPGISSVTAVMHESLSRHFAGSYALLASSSMDSRSFDSAFGGSFTMMLHSIVMNGLDDKKGRHMPFLSLENLSPRLLDKLEKAGQPLSRCYIGPDMPQIPIAKNIKYQPDTEKFSPYMQRIITYLWNDGDPQQVTISEISKNIGPGAYGNHSKLSYSPWGLLENGNKSRTRRLSHRGIKFAKGGLKIPEVIIKNADSTNWIAAPGTNMITMDTKEE